MKLLHTSLLVSLCSGLILYALGYYGHSNRHVQDRINEAQNRLDQAYFKSIIALKSGTSFSSLGTVLDQDKILYFVRQQDSLVYWNDNNFQISTLNTVNLDPFLQIEEGLYYFKSIQKDKLEHILGFPVCHISNKDYDRAALQMTIFSPDRTKSYFAKIDSGFHPWFQGLMIMLYFLLIISGVIGIMVWSKRWINQHRLLHGLMAFVGGIFSLRLVSLYIAKSCSWNAIALFDDSVKPSLLSPTLGDLLINIGLLCVLIWFIRSYIRPHYFSKSPGKGFGLGLLNYWLVYLSAFLMIHIFKQLVMRSGLSFDFEYIFYLDFKSILALSGILILAIALFILDLHLLRIIRHLGLTASQRLVANGLALMALVPFTYWLSTHLPLILLIGLGGYLTLLDLFMDHIKPHAAWYLTWTITGSILISSLLYQFHIDKELNQRLSLANELKQELIVSNIIGPHTENYLQRLLTKKETTSAYLVLYDLEYVKDLPKKQSLPLIPLKVNTHSIYTKIDDHSGFYLTKKSNQIFKAFSFFSYIFILFNLILVCFALLNRKVKGFSISWFKFFPSSVTLRYRIQISMLVMSLCSFMLIAFVIILYVKKNAWEWQKDDTNGQPSNWSLNELMNVAGTSNELYKIYDQEGWALPEKVARMSNQEWVALHKVNTNSNFSEYTSIQSNEGRNYFIKKTNPAERLQNKRKLNDFLGTLLNVYVFLLILIVLISMIVANSIARPLTILSSKLKQIQIGGSNQRLEWEHQDELGGLIRNYNEMIQELDRSTRMLALTERETAWREMAKQVAHEIKNPLTPMKLITQHLQNSIQRAESHEIPALVKRVTQTLIEQIDNLSKIASEFSNFAKLPAPENEKLVLNEVVTSTHDLFRKREDMDIHLRVPIDEIYVFADKNHIIRVLTNLIKNAIQSIPIGRRGRIEIILYKQRERAVVKIADNGCGIPDSMKDKVFYPNFTTKNSGTGLGLAIVRDIIDSSNGYIYFHTYENKGTEFYIELPLMHMEDNFREERRVSL